MREFVQTHVILAAGAGEVGLGAVALAPLPENNGDLGDPAGKFRAGIYCAQSSYLRAICSELEVQFCQKPIISAWPDQGDLHGNPRRPKVLHGLPRRNQKETKVGPRTEQIQKHPKETNKSQNYVHIKQIYADSLSTAIQRPASIS